MTILPTVISPVLYVLQCEHECVYVGITMNFNLRYAQHQSGSGARWTRLHKPLSVIEIIPNASLEMENQKTLEYMNEYGWENVRGGKWTKIDYKMDPR